MGELSWYDNTGVAIDRDGTLYCAGSAGDGNRFLLWAMTPELSPRWVRSDIELDASNARLALDRRGRLLVWQAGKPSCAPTSTATSMRSAAFGHNQAVRTLGPDGELRGMTPTSREWEAEEDKVIAARA